MKIIRTHEALEETKVIYNYNKLHASLKVAQSLKSKIFSSVKNLQKQARKEIMKK